MLMCETSHQLRMDSLIRVKYELPILQTQINPYLCSSSNTAHLMLLFPTTFKGYTGHIGSIGWSGKEYTTSEDVLLTKIKGEGMQGQVHGDTAPSSLQPSLPPFRMVQPASSLPFLSPSGRICARREKYLCSPDSTLMPFLYQCKSTDFIGIIPVFHWNKMRAESGPLCQATVHRRREDLVLSHTPLCTHEKARFNLALRQTTISLI